MFQESELKFRALLEYASIGIIIIDAEGRIQIVNAKVEELFGYRREELIGQPIEALVPGRFRETHARYCKGYRNEPSVRPMELSPHSFARRKDGRVSGRDRLECCRDSRRAVSDELLGRYH